MLLYVAFQSKCPEHFGENHVMNRLNQLIEVRSHTFFNNLKAHGITVLVAKRVGKLTVLLLVVSKILYILDVSILDKSMFLVKSKLNNGNIQIRGHI